MWFYTADTVSRVTSTRRPPASRSPRATDTTSHRLAGVLRSLADRIDTAGPARRPATDF